MAAPTFQVATSLGGAGTSTADFDVPTGVVAGSFVMIYLFEDPNNAVTPSSGFTEATGSPVTNSSATKPHRLHVYWKRATTTESGVYSFTVNATGLDWRQGWAVRYDGVIATGNPFDFTTTNLTDTAASPLPAVSGTTLGSDRLVVYAGSTYDGRTITEPSGFTARGTNTVAISDKTQTSAGSTGSVAATYAGGNTSSTVWMAALKGVGAGSVDTTKFFFMS